MISIITFSQNRTRAEKMAAYMKNHFSFVGVPATERKALIQPLLKDSKQLTLAELYDLVEMYYQKKEREYHYVAMELAIYNVKRMNLENVLSYQKFVTEKAWWDSVDTWRKFFGLYVKKNPEHLSLIFNLFFKNKHFWNRRVAITLQLSFRELTNTTLLEQAIRYDEKTNEFFIQKAIGWSLRDYSKTNPHWVKQIIETTHLSPLAIREGSKYLAKQIKLGE